MIKNIILIGALTAKPSVFNARSWELKKINTIDLFDSLHSNLQVNVRGSEIMRILPAFNSNINEDWIADKARFAYDGFNRWRFMVPLLKTDNSFFSASWSDVFNFFNKSLDKLNNLYFLPGNYSGLETLYISRKLTNKLGNKELYTDFDILTDFQSSYLLEDSFRDISKKKIYFLINLNTRLINPLINLKLKRLSESNNILIFYVGNSYDYNINFYHVGNTLQDFYNIILGKSPLCSIILKFFSNESKEINVISSKTIINLINNQSNLNSYFNKFGLNFNFIDFPAEASAINTRELNFNKFLHPSLLKSKLSYYLLGCDSFYNNKFLENKNFMIYQGHHNDTIRSQFDVILPTTTHFEDTNYFLNSYGFLQNTKQAVTPPTEARSDWKIIKMFSNSISIYLPYLKLSDVLKGVNNLSPIFTQNRTNIKFVDFKLKPITSLFVNKVYFTLFNNLNLNYYLTDSLSRSSKTMQKCSDTFFSKRSNYKKFTY